MAKLSARQAYVSSAIGFFADKFRKRYNLLKLFNRVDPLVIFGMYRDGDLEILKAHRGVVMVVWCGSDAMRIRRKRRWMEYLKGDNVLHYATSTWISNDLSACGITHKVLPIIPHYIDNGLHPRGDNIYFYYSYDGKKDFYGYPLVKRIEEKMNMRHCALKGLGIKIHHVTHDMYNPEQLTEIYKDCFLGFRLTPHDGVSVTAVELGLMGRRVIFNGDSPNSIKWQNTDDICDSILDEFESRHEDNKSIREAVENYVNIGTEWLRL